MPEPKFEDGPVLAPAPPKKVKKLKKYFKLSKLKSKLFFKYCSFPFQYLTKSWLNKITNT